MADRFVKSGRVVKDGYVVVDPELANSLMSELNRICDFADANGFDIEIQLVPLEPLAMGNYGRNITIRARRAGSSKEADHG